MGRRPLSQQDRRKYLGGHDAARIVGVSPYSGAGDTYARIVHGRDQEQTGRMLRGQLLEPGMLDYVSGLRGGVPIERKWFMIDDRIPFFGGSPDGLELHAGEPRVMHEVKCTGFHQRHRWGVTDTEDVPPEVFVQVQWYMGMLPAVQVAHVWTLFMEGDDDPLHYEIKRNDTSIAEIRRQCEAWWYDHILARKPPPPERSNANSLEVLYPRADKDVKPATPELVAHAAAYHHAREEAKKWQEVKEEHGNAIRAELGPHKGARWDGGSVSWSERKLPEKVNWEEVAHQLALKTKVAGEVFIGLQQENTISNGVARSLRVTLKGG